MSYLETSVIIAYGLDQDSNHYRALKLIECMRNVGNFHTSPITLVELYCVLARNIHKIRLPPGAEQISDEKSRLKFIISLLIKSLNILILSDEPEIKNFSGFKLFHKFFHTIQLAQEFKLSTLDTLHLAYAKQLVDKGIIKYFLTLDSEILKKEKEIQTKLGLKVKSCNEKTQHTV